ncbi:hypothetical protein VOLCADRAFT_104681 [Volvox carteri f. nagariensis]|uniref:Uncharacterized protein n=1 Tax=Volvox carteri f. nagariensis TaxID=3068 RepID=D8TV15_VOLCA|nr:uncharacterized protein VOLCADRAFT_104681 [Volvox carteri f. nagariensis]EFJ48499.1 hypothetical protein VOLCADRAFT_104681 [Volvox carteri f. nagariensis]|eukprot:XP_002950298.1 hypothetical protein VOLCADRAFT_104681 [Volvox carteri f. nagariensis]
MSHPTQSALSAPRDFRRGKLVSHRYRKNYKACHVERASARITAILETTQEIGSFCGEKPPFARSLKSLPLALVLYGGSPVSPLTKQNGAIRASFRSQNSRKSCLCRTHQPEDHHHHHHHRLSGSDNGDQSAAPEPIAGVAAAAGNPPFPSESISRSQTFETSSHGIRTMDSGSAASASPSGGAAAAVGSRTCFARLGPTGPLSDDDNGCEVCCGSGSLFVLALEIYALVGGNIAVSTPNSVPRTISRPRSAGSARGSQWRRAVHPSRFTAASRWSKHCDAESAVAASLVRQQQEQALSLERVIDGLDIDSIAALGFHGPDDFRGLVASEAVCSSALVTVPIGSTLAVSVDGDGGQLSVLSPPEMPPNVKKAIEVVAGLICDTPDYQLVILAVLLLWARKYGSTAWREYCEALLPPQRELSCLLCYGPGELSALQLPHLVDEAARQHDWARWVHSQWLSGSSGALRRLRLAEGLQETTWALALERCAAGLSSLRWG